MPAFSFILLFHFSHLFFLYSLRFLHFFAACRFCLRNFSELLLQSCCLQRRAIWAQWANNSNKVKRVWPKLANSNNTQHQLRNSVSRFVAFTLLLIHIVAVCVFVFSFFVFFFSWCTVAALLFCFCLVQITLELTWKANRVNAFLLFTVFIHKNQRRQQNAKRKAKYTYLLNVRKYVECINIM